MKLRFCLLISLSKRNSQNDCIFVAKVFISRSSLSIHILIFCGLCISRVFMYASCKVLCIQVINNRTGKSEVRICLQVLFVRKDWGRAHRNPVVFQPLFECDISHIWRQSAQRAPGQQGLWPVSSVCSSEYHISFLTESAPGRQARLPSPFCSLSSRDKI
jgi:hypothetical protein